MKYAMTTCLIGSWATANGDGGGGAEDSSSCRPKVLVMSR